MNRSFALAVKLPAANGRAGFAMGAIAAHGLGMTSSTTISTTSTRVGTG